MDIFKLIGIGIVATVAAVTIKPQKPEIALQISIVAGVLIFIAVADELVNALEVFNNISDKLGTDKEYIVRVLKVTGIAYLAEFAGNVCRDAGETGIATKIELAGKVIIFVMCTPMIQALFNIISSIL
jgi:stage III sporulation protein AD